MTGRTGAYRVTRVGTNEYIVLTALFRREDKVWQAEVVELGTAASGRTLNEAADRLGEFVELHLSALEDAGECERVLSERSITVYPAALRSDVAVYKVNTDVPAGSFAAPLIKDLPCRTRNEAAVAVG